MTVSTGPDHLLSLAEWARLPEEPHRRVELAEGVLQVSPRPVPRHQLVVAGLLAELRRHLPPSSFVLPEVEVVVDGADPPTVRVPDLCVVRESALDGRHRLEPSDVLAVVEVLSPGTRRVDRVLKLAEYAEAAIPTYLIVEPGPPVTVVESLLHDGRYRIGTEQVGIVSLALLDQAAIDLSTL